MKKFIVFALVMVFVLAVSDAFAVDWSQYESGRNNIRLDGYQSQPGYIAFTDGNATTLGYLWMSTGSGLVWASNNAKADAAREYGGSSVGAIDLTTTKLTNDYGVPISDAWSGDIANNVP